MTSVFSADILQEMERVLIVSASPAAASRMKAWLGEETECTVSPDMAAARLLLDTQSFDWVVVNVSASDGTSNLSLAAENSGEIPFLAQHLRSFASAGIPVLLLLAQDAYQARVPRLAAKGIFALPKPLSPSQFAQAAWLLRAASRQTRRLQGRLETVRSVERAKWLLMQTLQMDEGQAHRYIEKQAMNQRRAKREVAEDIIKTYEN